MPEKTEEDKKLERQKKAEEEAAQELHERTWTEEPKAYRELDMMPIWSLDYDRSF